MRRCYGQSGLYDETDVFVPVSINEILERSLELHAHKMRVSNIEMVAELDPDLPATMADADQIHQVFVNIITNANQAMIEKQGDGRLCVKTQRLGKSIRVSFEDSGPGIREENLTSVFDPFFTTKEVGRGTGQGLAIGHSVVVEKHGGTIDFETTLGEGTTFIIRLPVGEKGS